ncbi:MAG TPA: hypothetical protein VMP03_02400 [Methylomirabilota bacterium]|nr:hypothetical protein [Methylomirabilota bacterium]
MYLSSLVCRNVYAACTYAVFEVLQPSQDYIRPSFSDICREVAESDRNGEVVSVRVGPLYLKSGQFGLEIFLKDDEGLYGFGRHHDPKLEVHCLKLLESVFPPLLIP